jgi:hypothetical protein
MKTLAAVFLVAFPASVILTTLQAQFAAAAESPKAVTPDDALGREFHLLWPLGKPIYVDRQGKVALRVKGGEAHGFSEGLAGVEVDGRWGFIDPRGKWVVPPRFDRVGSFSQGLAAVEIEGKWGYADRAGNVVIRPQFTSAGHFHDGVAKVNVGAAFDFHLTSNFQYGVIDRKGEWIVQPGYRAMNDFSEGLARVWGFKDGLMDRTGRLVLDLSAYDYTGPSIAEGLIAVMENHRMGYMDRNGKWAIAPQFAWGEEFSEGMAAVALFEPPEPEKSATSDVEGKHRLLGYINRSGEVIVRPQFAEAGPFRGGLARVRPNKTEGSYGKGDRWGYIDKTGKIVIPLDYNEVWDFENGLAWVHRGGNLPGFVFHQVPQWEGGEWLLIDATGKIIWSEGR